MLKFLYYSLYLCTECFVAVFDENILEYSFLVKEVKSFEDDVFAGAGAAMFVTLESILASFC